MSQWKARAGRRTRTRTFVPRLEALEDRTLLAIIPVGPGQAIKTIQGGVNAASVGDIVLVDPSTYTEQVTINKSLTIEGNGAGAIIQAPSTLTPDAFGLNVLVEVFNAATVNLNNLTVQGPAPNINDGILIVGGATANVTGTTVAQIQDPATFGDQTGFGIQVGGTGAQAVGEVGNAAITNCTVTGYQKVGIIIGRNGSSGTITGCTITGVGPTPQIAQNGIQIGPGATDTATISNNTISGNEYTGAGSGANPFTAVQADGILNLIDSNSITGNTVFGNDEGIFSTNTGSTSAGTTISGNTVQNNRFENVFLGEGTATVSNNTITGSNIGVAVVALIGDTTNAVGNLVSNNITNNGNVPVGFSGGGIVLLNQTGATTTAQATANFNRIVGNSVGLDNTTATLVDATNNFWGSNAGPGGAGSDTVSGPVTFNPRLVLQVTASPTSVPPGGVASVIADLTMNSSGMDTSALGHLPDGIPLSFATSAGTILPPTGATAAGKAVAQFTAGSTFGSATVSATVDNQTSTATITVIAPPPLESLAFGPSGAVREVVGPDGTLTQYDATGDHVLGGGVRSASVAFGPGGEELLVTFQDGRLFLFDAQGGHFMGAGVLSASIAFGPQGAVIEVVSLTGQLTQFDAQGAHALGGGVTSTSVAFGPGGQALLVTFQDGRLMRFDAKSALTLGSGVLSAGLAFDAIGAEVIDVLFQDGTLTTFSSAGSESLGKVF